VTVLIALSLLNLAATGYLVYRDRRSFERLERSLGIPLEEKFTPIPVFRRFGRDADSGRATSSRVSIVRRGIEQEEAESQRLQVIS
jgi:hypothetical protein